MPRKSCKCPPEKKNPPNSLSKLKALTTISADTGDFEAINNFKEYISDATTNPSLILKAIESGNMAALLDKAIAFGKENGKTKEEQANAAIDMLNILFAKEFHDRIPGIVSIELDPRLSFEKDGTIKRGKAIIAMLDKEGVDKSRIYLKVAGTWEGIQAAKELEADGIKCNVTLVFSLVQAAVTADAKISIISPFVGRVKDFYEAKGIPSSKDLGVELVTDIYNYNKKFNYNTKVIAASMRTTEQVIAVAGCDIVTISTAIMEKLKESKDDVPQRLSPEKGKESNLIKLDLSEGEFRWFMNEDEMACEKLADGIRKFTVDIRKLEGMLKSHLGTGSDIVIIEPPVEAPVIVETIDLEAVDDAVLMPPPPPPPLPPAPTVDVDAQPNTEEPVPSVIEVPIVTIKAEPTENVTEAAAPPTEGPAEENPA